MPDLCLAAGLALVAVDVCIALWVCTVTTARGGYQARGDLPPNATPPKGGTGARRP